MAQAAEMLAAPDPSPPLRVVPLESPGRSCCGDPYRHRHRIKTAPTDPAYTLDALRGWLASWRRLRSHYEHRGDIDDMTWTGVLDTERMVTALANYPGRHDPAEATTPEERRRRKIAGRDAQQAAEMVAVHLLLGWSAEDRRFPHQARRLERKVLAFAERYLAGAGFAEADRAFEEAG